MHSKQVPGIDVWEKALENRDSSVRLEAVFALDRLNAVEPLTKALDDENPVIRRTAVQALARLKAVEPLTKALDDEDSMVRLEAVFALDRLNAVEPLTKALDDENPVIRRTAVQALARLKAVEPFYTPPDSTTSQGFLRRLFAALASWLRRWKRPTLEERLAAEAERVRAAATELGTKLARQAEQVQQLQAIVHQREQQEQMLVARVRGYLNAGQREAAQRTVLELEHVRELVKENRAQLEEAQRLYAEVQRLHDTTLDEVRRQEERIAHRLTQTETARGQQELAESADRQLSQIVAASERLERMHRDLDAQAVKAQVHAEVSTEVLGLSDAAAKQAQQQSHAEMLLKEFETEEHQKRLTS